MPRGGARPGAGRKPKDRQRAALHGSRQRSVVRFPTPPAAIGAVTESIAEDVVPPSDQTPEILAVWAVLAPLAIKRGTLTVTEAEAFALHCSNVVIERALRQRDPGGSSHRGMIQRVDAGNTKFMLAPIGKPIAQAPREVDPFAEFDQVGGAQ